MAFLAWFFFGPKKAREAEEKDGVQEVRITVKGGYSPDVIRVKEGVPLRLVFDRQGARAPSGSPTPPSSSSCRSPGVLHFPALMAGKTVTSRVTGSLAVVPGQQPLLHSNVGFIRRFKLPHRTSIAGPVAGLPHLSLPSGNVRRSRLDSPRGRIHRRYDSSEPASFPCSGRGCASDRVTPSTHHSASSGISVPS